MQAAQFQIEPKEGINSLPALSRRTNPCDTSGATQVDLESLFLGLELRGWLTDQDKECLDRIAPEGFIAFLIHKDRYLHPENLELFPIDHIRTTLMGGGDAHFSHRHCSGPGSSGRLSAIHTACVAEVRGEPIILGIVGPELVHRRSNIHDDFGSLTRLCRRAAQSVREPLATIRRLTDSDQPVLVVNRTSGRVMALNSPALSLLDSDSRAVVGSEYGVLKARLASFTADRSLKIDNIANQGMHLSVVSLVKAAAATTAAQSDPIHSMLESMRNKLCCIASSARSLESMAARIPGEAHTELVRIINEEAHDLDSQIKRLRLLISHSHEVKSETDPSAEMRKVVESIRRRRQGAAIDLEVEGNPTLRIEMPPSALYYLLESVMEAHVVARCSSGRTIVHMAHDSATLRLLVRTTGLNNPAVTQSHRDRVSYARQLAAGLSLGFVSNADTSASELETTITISK
jgi:hypothetical protein